MKKLSLLFLVIFLTGTIAMSEDLGLTAGLEMGFLDLLGDDVDENIYIMPSIAYENDELVPGLELYAALGIPFWFVSDFALGFDLDLRVAYNLEIGSASTFGFFLHSENFIPAAKDKQHPYSPLLEDATNKFTSWLTPGVSFVQSMDFGDLYAELGVPMYLAPDPFDYTGLDLTLGADFSMGLGAGVTIENWIRTQDRKNDYSFFDIITLFCSYETGPFWAGLDFAIPAYKNGIKLEGMTISPELRYMVLDNLQIYLGADIGNIGGKKVVADGDDEGNSGDISLGLFFGARFSF